MTAKSQQDQLKEMHDQLADGIEALTTGEDWKNMLSMSAKMWRYSWSNQMLIGIQCPQASVVYGYKSWQKFGRQVRKGEHGIAILAPVSYRTKMQEGEQTPVEQDAAAKAQKVLKGFRVARVFDVSQTDGPELPTPKLLTGDAPKELWEVLAKQVGDLGWTIKLGDPTNWARGASDPKTKTITIRSDMEPLAQLRTLIHELAHVKLGHTDFIEDYSHNRAEWEAEAEGTAYVVLSAANIDTSSYSFPYVGSWSGGDIKLIRHTAEHVVQTSREIISQLPGFEPTQELEQSAGLER